MKLLTRIVVRMNINFAACLWALYAILKLYHYRNGGRLRPAPVFLLVTIAIYAPVGRSHGAAFRDHSLSIQATMQPLRLTTSGDEDENATFAGVGRVLSEWEAIELTLSHIYSGFTGRLEVVSAIREYGEKTVFTFRLAALRTAAQGFFCGRPDQALESEFDAIVVRCKEFSSHRNDIAHGIVGPLNKVSDPRSPGETVWRYHLLPPDYTTRKFNDLHLPLYAHDARTMSDLARRMFEFRRDLIGYRFKLWPHSDLYMLPQPNRSG